MFPGMRTALIVVLVFLALLACAAWALYVPDRSRAELEPLYLRPPPGYVEAAGVRLHVHDTGPRDGPAVVLVHGFGSSLHTWEDWAAVLERTHRVIRFDVPGFGLTGADSTGDYTDARAVAVLRALMDRLGVARASLVGNSMGGKFAWMFAAKHPDRVDKLVLVSPDGFASRGFEYGKRPSVPWLLRLLPYVLPEYLLRKSMEGAFADPTRLTPALLARYRDMLLAPGVRRAVVERVGQVELQDPRPLLAQITAPTLLVWGARDAMIPVRNAQDYLAAVKGSRLLELPGVGHVPQEETPEVVGDVARFLAE